MKFIDELKQDFELLANVVKLLLTGQFGPLSCALAIAQPVAQICIAHFSLAVSLPHSFLIGLALTATQTLASFMVAMFGVGLAFSPPSNSFLKTPIGYATVGFAIAMFVGLVFTYPTILLATVLNHISTSLVLRTVLLSTFIGGALSTAAFVIPTIYPPKKS